jgi:hypothetical protein
LLSFVESSPGFWGFPASGFISMKTIRQSQLARAWSRRSRVGDIVIFDVLGAAPRGSGATEAAAREDVRRVAESLRAPDEDFNGEAFLIVPG